ncbi:MAG: AAA family ATPase, partial [Candidatus Omnitrophica bacterium]|nr:AAA family ATPase [Candidatus Omnitrophota bacterium]
TDDNLLRINDIVVEVKRQISSIERQAQKAQRYKEEFEKLKGMEQILAIYQLKEFSQEREGIQAFLASVKSKEEDYSKDLEEYRQVVERESMLLEDLETKVHEARQEDLKIDNQIELNNRQIGFNEERLENLAQNELKVAEQKKVLLEKCRAHQEKIDELERMLMAFVQEMEQAIAELNGRKGSLASIAALIEEYQAGMRQDEEKILSLSSRSVEIRNQQTESMKESQGCIARRRRLEIEQGKALAEKDAVDRRLHGISQGMMEILARRERLGADLSSEKDSLLRHNEELNGLMAQIDGLEKKKLFLISQKDFIEKMQVQYQDMPDPVISGRFLSTMPPTNGQSGFIGKIKEVIAVDPSRFEAIRAQFGNIEAQAFYEIVCETKYVELDPLTLAAQIEAIEGEIRNLIVLKEAKLGEISERSKLVERIQIDIHGEEKRLSVCEAQQSDVGAEARKIFEELQTVEMEIREADESLTRSQQAEECLKNEMKTVEAEILFAQEGIKGREVLLADKRREREEMAVSVAQADAEISSMREREQSWKDNLAMFQGDMNGYLEEVSRLDAEAASFNTKRDHFNVEIGRLETSIEEFKASKEDLKETLSRYEAEEQDVSQRLNSVRAQIAMMEKEIASNRDTLHDRAMRVQQLEFQEQSVRERMLQRYSMDMTQVLSVESAPVVVEGTSGLEDVVQPELNVEALKEEIARLTKRCESYGGVNLMAIDEFEELKNRFQFLTKQQSDLLTAKDSLEQTIRKINRTTRELFMNTFVKVNEQFRVYFRMLFNGGEAQLILIDPENALESGIEIVARPPGKKLQTISLLSGGEKTMTAIALIFSVFKVNPSPFCVLDEIDAALDEANVDRFARVLKEFAKIAQFIVITHNKKTIANANVMYGVTMQQTGVSRVVSVKLSEHKVDEVVLDSGRAVPAPENDSEPQVLAIPKVEQASSEAEALATV